MRNFTYCCVPQCRSFKKRSMHLSFFKFPERGRKATVVNTNGKSTVDLRKQWILKLKMRKKVSSYMKICSLHFVESDFFPLQARSKRRFLKPYAIPSVYLPTRKKLNPQPSAPLRKMCYSEHSPRTSERVDTLNDIHSIPPTASKTKMESVASTFIKKKNSDITTETISSIGSNSRELMSKKYSMTPSSEHKNLKLENVNSLKLNTQLNKLDSFCNFNSVTYTKLIPIVEGVQNLTRLVDFNSPSRVLWVDNDSCDVKTENVLFSNNRKNSLFENFHHNIADDSDCIIIEDENQCDIEIFNEFNSQIINNPVDALLNEQENVDCSQESHLQTSDVYYLKDPLSANENDAELEIKPFVFSDLSSISMVNTHIEVKTDLQEFHIKDEFCGELSSSDYNLNTEMIIKSEETSCNLGGDQIEEKGNSSRLESTEKFLMNSPVVFSKFCGLPSMSMFNALLQYVEDDMKPLQGVTKFEQLFSILAKLHKNENNLYLNKYVFPPAYINTVEILYTKLKLWCNESPDFSSVPEVFTPEFDLRQKIVLVGITTVGIRSSCKEFSKKVKFVKYLVAYTAFGEVFFVSKAFVSAVDTLKLITYCGILRKLGKEHWIIFHQDDVLHAVQTKFFFKKWRNSVICRIASDEIQSYFLLVVNRLCEHFKILKDLIPDFMLYSKNRICFLDRLVFVCCMLLNMLPKVTYM